MAECDCIRSSHIWLSNIFLHNSRISVHHKDGVDDFSEDFEDQEFDDSIALKWIEWSEKVLPCKCGSFFFMIHSFIINNRSSNNSCGCDYFQ
jgi:hypothetical protein